MGEKLELIVQGERSRLFPVLSETSKEGRTLSILLSCIEYVDDFGQAMLADLGIRAGVRSKIETYTEVVLRKTADKKFRPDGLIVVRTGSRTWTALIEAKVGNSELTAEQIESYLDLAKQNGIDAVITISNQFAPIPSHHPVSLNATALKKCPVLHWSWQYVLTQATLLIRNNKVVDRDQSVILNEMVRFLTHPSAGVQSFDQMPAAWPTLVSTVQVGGGLSARSLEVQEVVGAWYQETQDLSLILSRQLGEEVDVKLQRAYVADPSARMKADAQTLVDQHCLKSVFSVPNTASTIEVTADLAKRSIFASMRINAPADRKSTKARLNWLLRQLQKSNPDHLHIRMIWPGRGQNSQFPLTILRENVDVADSDGKVASSFEVVYARDLAGRFAQRKNFIIELERAVPDFYEQAGQHLKAWQPPAPKLKDDRSEPDSVNTEALREEAEVLRASEIATPSRRNSIEDDER